MAAAYSSLLGQVVGGKYEIRQVLGAGGMGVVCEATHLDLGKRVALKLIDVTMKECELMVTRFRREARAAGQIRSEHIVDVFDVGADPRLGLYIVMELLVGEDLQTRLEREHRLDVRTAVMLGHQLARALAKAHAAGVIHRDIKPANVFLTTRDNGQLLAKLLDFGVSKLLGDQPGSARITGRGAPLGTPLYMSPEQAEARADVDARADIWSLGAVLYEALSGSPPFADRGSYHGTLLGILTSRPRLLSEVASGVPREIGELIDAMLVHDRDARVPDALTVSRRLFEVHPDVLPDGTGQHTAVIVSTTAPGIDPTGDTEFFAPNPASDRRRPSLASFSDFGPLGTLCTPRSEPDRTGSGAEPADGRDALRTRPATPRELELGLYRGAKGAADAHVPQPSATLPDLSDPTFGDDAEDFGPDTTLDLSSAIRPLASRWLTLLALVVTMLVVGALGYVVGRSASTAQRAAASTEQR